MKETEKFKGKILNVYVKEMRLPNGYLSRIEIVKHPGAVLIAPLLSKNKIILLKQYRPVIGSYIYELPQGPWKKESGRKTARAEK
jgi:ADP-ribose pyrophosphatase